MDRPDRISALQLVAAFVFVVLFAIWIAVEGSAALVTLLIPAPFALFMFYLAMRTDDFRFGQHDEDTPYMPEAEHRAAISYGEPEQATR